MVRRLEAHGYASAAHLLHDLSALGAAARRRPEQADVEAAVSRGRQELIDALCVADGAQPFRDLGGAAAAAAAVARRRDEAVASATGTSALLTASAANGTAENGEGSQPEDDGEEESEEEEAAEEKVTICGMMMDHLGGCHGCTLPFGHEGRTRPSSRPREGGSGGGRRSSARPSRRRSPPAPSCTMEGSLRRARARGYPGGRIRPPPPPPPAPRRRPPRRRPPPPPPPPLPSPRRRR